MDKKGRIFGYTNTVASSKESHITIGLTLNVQGVKTALTFWSRNFTFKF